MAGRLLFFGKSVQARSLNFPSFYVSSFQCYPWRSSKCRIGSRRKKNLVCSCLKPTSFGLVSTSERPDGSVVFHFGDATEMIEGESPVEASVHFENSGVKVGTVDLSNEETENVVCPDVTEGVCEEEENSDGSLILALTEGVGSEAMDSCSGVSTEEVDDQLVLSGTMDQPGDSQMVAAATMEAIDFGNGPIEEIQLKSEATNDFSCNMSVMENNRELAVEDFTENSMEESQNPVFLADDEVPEEDSDIIKNDLDTNLTIEGGSDVTSDVDQAGDSLRMEKLKTITEDAALTSVGLDTDIDDAIKHSEEHANVIIYEESRNPVFLADNEVPEDSDIIKNDLDTYLKIEGGSDADQTGDLSRSEKLDTITEDAALTSVGLDTDIVDAINHSKEDANVIIYDLPDKVEEKDDLNLANQFLSGNIFHRSEIIQVSNLPEVLPSPSEEARDEILIDAHEKDMTRTLAALDAAASLNQEEAIENEKASAGFGVAALVSHEEMQTEKTDVKREDTSAMELLYLSSGVASLPHPSKESTGGEDVHFVNGNWLGIADGVGQWSMEGANASSYAQELLENCVEILSSSKSNLMTDPVEVIVRGAGETHSSGLSTVMMASFDGQVLRVAGIGDSGFIIIRNGNVLEKSVLMLHEFNLPLQIHKGIDPSQLIKVYSVRLDEDDVIVLGTNGLFDNLYEQEIALIVNDCLQSCQGTKEIALLLAERAGEVRISKFGRSPFADAAHAAGYVGYTGGKLDDVTVVVSLVVKRNPESRL